MQSYWNKFCILRELLLSPRECPALFSFSVLALWNPRSLRLCGWLPEWCEMQKRLIGLKPPSLVLKAFSNVLDSHTLNIGCGILSFSFLVSTINLRYIAGPQIITFCYNIKDKSWFLARATVYGGCTFPLCLCGFSPRTLVSLQVHGQVYVVPVWVHTFIVY